jgi:hypothetical protein
VEIDAIFIVGCGVYLFVIVVATAFVIKWIIGRMSYEDFGLWRGLVVSFIYFNTLSFSEIFFEWALKPEGLTFIEWLSEPHYSSGGWSAIFTLASVLAFVANFFILEILVKVVYGINWDKAFSAAGVILVFSAILIFLLRATTMLL